MENTCPSAGDTTTPGCAGTAAADCGRNTPRKPANTSGISRQRPEQPDTSAASTSSPPPIMMISAQPHTRHPKRPRQANGSSSSANGYPLGCGRISDRADRESRGIGARAPLAGPAACGPHSRTENAADTTAAGAPRPTRSAIQNPPPGWMDVISAGSGSRAAAVLRRVVLGNVLLLGNARSLSHEATQGGSTGAGTNQARHSRPRPRCTSSEARREPRGRGDRSSRDEGPMPLTCPIRGCPKSPSLRRCAQMSAHSQIPLWRPAARESRRVQTVCRNWLANRMPDSYKYRR